MFKSFELTFNIIERTFKTLECTFKTLGYRLHLGLPNISLGNTLSFCPIIYLFKPNQFTVIISCTFNVSVNCKNISKVAQP